jgi:hypothetical protein
MQVGLLVIRIKSLKLLFLSKMKTNRGKKLNEETLTNPSGSE